MKHIKTTALAGALALGAAGLIASPAVAKKKDAAAEAGKPQFSPAFQQSAQPLQKALQAGDIAAAQAALGAAQQAASTPDDKYSLGIMTFQIGQKTNSTDLMSQGADMASASGKAPPEVQSQLLNVKGVNAYNKGDLASADAAFTQIYQANPGDGDNAILLAQTKIREKQPQAAIPIIDKAIQAKKASGQPVPEDWYKRALAVAYDAKMPAETAKFGQQLVAAYPTPGNWRAALQTYRDTNKAPGVSDIDTLRLMRVTKSLAGERDYYEYANLANDRGYPGEAKGVIDEGQASSVVDNQALKTSKAIAELKNLAAPKVAADKASLPKLEAGAKSAADGKRALQTGDAYLGYGQFAKAAELYKVAQQKGGVDASLVNLRLGQALAQSGQKDAAVQAFGQVSGPNLELAHYWTMYAQGGAAPAAPAAGQ